MTIWNLGSVNVDMVYRLPHLPEAGETLSALKHKRGLGGKGANMSVAAVRAGSKVEHIGAIGADGAWMKERLASYGVAVGHLDKVGPVSGHAIVAINPEGDNQIIICPASNVLVDEGHVADVLVKAKPDDIAICQNETNGQLLFVRTAKERGLRVVYAAAPFMIEATTAILPDVDLLIVNAVEAEQLEKAMGQTLDQLPVADIIVTLGADGCRWIATGTGQQKDYAAQKVPVVDTTGAGDTFTGFLVAALDQGSDMDAAIDLALKAAAIMVTRFGTADVVPSRAEVDETFPER